MPDSSRRSGEWIGRYIKQVNPTIDTVNYFTASHFNNDHIGNGLKGAGLTENRDPNYQLSGIAEVGEFIHFNKVINRAFPSYDFPILSSGDPDIANYKKFLDWKIKSAGLTLKNSKLVKKIRFIF